MCCEYIWDACPFLERKEKGWMGLEVGKRNGRREKLEGEEGGKVPIYLDVSNSNTFLKKKWCVPPIPGHTE